MRAIKAKVSDPVQTQARLLKLLPIAIPIRLEGETETGLEVGEVMPEVAEPMANEQAAVAVSLLPSSDIVACRKVSKGALAMPWLRRIKQLRGAWKEQMRMICRP